MSFWYSNYSARASKRFQLKIKQLLAV